MGRQVNFYMLPEDLPEFEQMLKKKEATFIPYELSSNSITTVTTLIHNGVKSSRPAFKVYLAQEKGLQNAEINYIASQNFWLVDELRSTVVELEKSAIRDHIIQKGRLYFNTGYYDQEGHWVEKPKDFIRWADSLLRWVRSHYIKDPQTDCYVAPQTKKLVETGEYSLSRL